MIIVMLTRVNRVVRFSVLSCILTSMLLVHLVAPALVSLHPVLGRVLLILEGCGWLVILGLWAVLLHRVLRRRLPVLGTRLRRALDALFERKQTHAHTAVPAEALTDLCGQVQWVGLALHGLTPEMDRARRLHFQQLGEAVPPLVVPPAYAGLYAEFERLLTCLKQAGFPSLKDVRLQPQELAFFQHWLSDLETRIPPFQHAGCEATNEAV